MKSLRILAIGAALIAGSTALASAQHWDRDDRHDRDHDRHDNDRHFDRDRGRGDHDRDDRRFRRDRDDWRFRGDRDRVTAMTADIMQRRDTTTGRVTMPRSITGHVTVSSASSTAITGRGTAIAGAATTEAAHSTSTSKRGAAKQS